MAPPTPTYPVSSLASEINTLPSGKPRKRPINLSDCALKEMVQHKCNIKQEKSGELVVVCNPVVRMYRVCKDGLHVETTAWEGLKVKQDSEEKL